MTEQAVQTRPFCGDCMNVTEPDPKLARLAESKFEDLLAAYRQQNGEPTADIYDEDEIIPLDELHYSISWRSGWTSRDGSEETEWNEARITLAGGGAACWLLASLALDEVKHAQLVCQDWMKPAMVYREDRGGILCSIAETILF